MILTVLNSTGGQHPKCKHVYDMQASKVVFESRFIFILQLYFFEFLRPQRLIACAISVNFQRVIETGPSDRRPGQTAGSKPNFPHNVFHLSCPEYDSFDVLCTAEEFSYFSQSTIEKFHIHPSTNIPIAKILKVGSEYRDAVEEDAVVLQSEMEKQRAKEKQTKEEWERQGEGVKMNYSETETERGAAVKPRISGPAAERPNKSSTTGTFAVATVEKVKICGEAVEKIFGARFSQPSGEFVKRSSSKELALKKIFGIHGTV
ncbi:hypothetical protein WH47_02186 [Habropoda laboriosa]|uniref:Uncharacterized protein n=1 Tax=Habropoda laboriosa TaxID=597456 RepID=A0A0L7RJ83_9HYME|nr:hypothetical protein WH47_02186 [Habropoda laboriosa]